MEPPTKRLRLTGGLHHGSDNGRDGVCELSSQPEELLRQHDPDDELVKRRAMAGNKFQRAMAGIFSKYGRDFTDVGDEIDLETGEVIVDNGHLAHMRYEGDVGVEDDSADDQGSEEEGIRLGDMPDEDDEGIRLEDIRDDWDGECDAQSEEDPPTHRRPFPRASNDRNRASSQGHTESEEEDRIMHRDRPRHASDNQNRDIYPGADAHGHMIPRHAPPQYPMALVPASNQAMFGGFPVLPVLPMNGFFLGLDPRAGVFSNSSSFNAQPWELPGGWGLPEADSLPKPKLSPRRPSRTRRGRPSQTRSFENSIWAPGSGYEDSWLPRQTEGAGKRGRGRKSMPRARGTAGRRGRPRKTMPSSRLLPPSHGTCVEGGDGAITENGKQWDSSSGGHVLRDITDVEDDLAHSHEKPHTSSKAQAMQHKGIGMPKSHPDDPGKSKLNKAEPSETQTPKGDNPVENTSLIARRRSLRERKPPDFLGKISWAEALSKGRESRLVVELRMDNRPRYDDYENTNHGEQGLPTPPESGHEGPTDSGPPHVVPQSSRETIPDSQERHEGSTDSEPPHVVPGRETIPDSQETASSRRSLAQQEGTEDREPRIRYTIGNPSNALSDDEMPVLFTKPKRPKASQERGRALPPSKTSPTEHAPSKASPSKRTPSKASPSKASPSKTTQFEATPSKPSPSKATPSKSSASKPHTPRHTAIQTTQAPSSRRSILSLLSSSDDENDDDEDELLAADSSHALTLPKLFATSTSSSARKSKTWRASARTTEAYRTPVARRVRDAFSPASVVKTPGGTVRTCGVDGYRCGADFCFSCL